MPVYIKFYVDNGILHVGQSSKTLDIRSNQHKAYFCCTNDNSVIFQYAQKEGHVIKWESRNILLYSKIFIHKTL